MLAFDQFHYNLIYSGLTNRTMTKPLLKCLLYVSILVSVRSDCPLGFMRFQESCYAILPVKVSWAEALRLCQAFQAKLAWIDSAIEDKFIEGMLNRYHDSIATSEVWMGGTDMLIEGIWMWADSLKPFTYTNWFPGEPNNFLTVRLKICNNA
ncbi:perlucin-like [Mytilus edulis]|uniref:perlucin-like n=1 Tax=Mytilus edulis TaxID=6550 RepID=UPI0039EFC2C0